MILLINHQILVGNFIQQPNEHHGGLRQITKIAIIKRGKRMKPGQFGIRLDEILSKIAQTAIVHAALFLAHVRARLLTRARPDILVVRVGAWLRRPALARLVMFEAGRRGRARDHRDGLFQLVRRGPARRQHGPVPIQSRAGHCLIQEPLLAPRLGDQRNDLFLFEERVQVDR